MHLLKFQFFKVIICGKSNFDNFFINKLSCFQWRFKNSRKVMNINIVFQKYITYIISAVNFHFNYVICRYNDDRLRYHWAGLFVRIWPHTLNLTNNSVQGWMKYHWTGNLWPLLRWIQNFHYLVRLAIIIHSISNDNVAISMHIQKNITTKWIVCNSWKSPNTSNKLQLK